MKTQKSDRRIQKTRKFLLDALISLIIEKDYDDISVQEVLDRADVGRSTFYSHFQNKDELLLSGMNDLREMLDLAGAAEGAGVQTAGERLLGFSRAMFEHAAEFRHLFEALMRGGGGRIIRERMEEMLTDLIRERYNREFANRPSDDTPSELLIRYLSASFLTVLYWWQEQPRPGSPAEIDQQFRTLVLPLPGE